MKNLLLLIPEITDAGFFSRIRSLAASGTLRSMAIEDIAVVCKPSFDAAPAITATPFFLVSFESVKTTDKGQIHRVFGTLGVVAGAGLFPNASFASLTISAGSIRFLKSGS